MLLLDARRGAAFRYYEAALPGADGAVLDLCSSWTSHYPKGASSSTRVEAEPVRAGYKAKRVAALGLNAIELLANPCKTEWTVQNLNKNQKLPYDDASFDVVTNSLSVDYLTSPLEVMKEVKEGYDTYDFSKVVQALLRFCTADLSNLYLDVAKDRLYISEADDFRRRSAQTVIAEVLEGVTLALAPLLPLSSSLAHSRAAHDPQEQLTCPRGPAMRSEILSGLSR